MAVDLKEVKTIIHSILISSKDPLSIEKLRKEYRNLEGVCIPFRNAGFNSDIEFLQSMSDILNVPPNPNQCSILTPISDEKTIHLKLLIDKQKSNTHKKNNKSNLNGQCKNMNKCYKKMPNSTKIIVQNNNMNNTLNRNNYGMSVNMYSSSNRGWSNQPSSANGSNHLNQKISNQNGVQNHTSINVTNKLRAFLEFNLSKNHKPISINKLEELIRNHEDFQVLKTEDMNKIFNELKSFLNINDSEVSLKCRSQINTNGNMPVIYPILDEPSKLSKEYFNKLHNNSDIHSTKENNFKNCYKTSNGSKQFGHYQNISINDSSELKINNQQNHTGFNLEIFLRKTHDIPKKVRLNIVNLCQVFKRGENIENFKVFYYEAFDSTLEPSIYGFSSAVQMFEAFDEIITIKNNVLYTKPNILFSELKKSIPYNDKSAKQGNIIENNELEISLKINERSPYLNFHNMHKMVMVEAFNPSLFYLQPENSIEVLESLMNQMMTFYDKENSNYCVQPEQIIPGFMFASSYTSFSDVKKCHRIKILREINSMTVEVIHVDFGTVDIIPKKEIRFLLKRFCKLPCQAIHCCLQSYNELESIAPEVTKAFLEIIDNKPVHVAIDEYFTLNSFKVFHVTLFKNENKNSKKLININDLLTIHHLNC